MGLLAKAYLYQKKWQKAFASLPRPLTAVIVGGSIKGKAFALDNARELGRQIRALKERIGGSVLITDSKRTGSRARGRRSEPLGHREVGRHVAAADVADRHRAAAQHVHAP